MGQEQSQIKVSESQTVAGQTSKPQSTPTPAPSKIESPQQQKPPSPIAPSKVPEQPQSTWWNSFSSWGTVTSSSSSSNIKTAETKKKSDDVYERIPTYVERLPPPPPQSLNRK
ncbi:unnamed protein product [Caenorhabditis angaria]|uniref:Uncharacterized protein n=1 Tax=Caenorhabditis angaria TaxID=860376 RepID=A0A9P1ICU9_9PELO|nr:unnamed protein product [Caenorhabditis angaria]